ncbi:MAG TPA: EAL domain-containing protein [Kineosporiaceae bacterium]|nr:EAL domain-containing protein [Kineosporiaceae bacterium]
MLPGSTNAAIVASAVQLAHTLGLRTVAEGVETPQALALLRRLGCQTAQGYLLGRPVPADQLPRTAVAATAVAATVVAAAS